MTKTKRVKTTEEILKANLAKTMGRIKTRVADREELWLNFFQDILEQSIGYYYEQERKGLLKDHVLEASSIADWALDAYEDRWGKGC